MYTCTNGTHGDEITALFGHLRANRVDYFTPESFAREITRISRWKSVRFFPHISIARRLALVIPLDVNRSLNYIVQSIGKKNLIVIPKPPWDKTKSRWRPRCRREAMYERRVISRRRRVINFPRRRLLKRGGERKRVRNATEFDAVICFLPRIFRGTHSILRPELVKLRRGGQNAKRRFRSHERWD